MTYKQDFIDENPYLTYSGKADSAYDGEGGEQYVLPTASADTLGGVKVGSGLAISDEGVLSASGYSLPTASADTLGGVKVGSGLAISGEGVLSASGGQAIQLILKYQYSNTEYTFPAPSSMSANEIVEALASGAVIDVYWADVDDVKPYELVHSRIKQTVDSTAGSKTNWYVLVENIDSSSQLDCIISGTNIGVFD